MKYREGDVCSHGEVFPWHGIWRLSVYREKLEKREKKTDSTRVSSTASYTERRKRKIESASPLFPTGGSPLPSLAAAHSPPDCAVECKKGEWNIASARHDAWNSSFENSFVIRDARLNTAGVAVNPFDLGGTAKITIFPPANRVRSLAT